MSELWIDYIDGSKIADLVARADQTQRRRLNLNLHPRLDDPIQRLLNAGSPGSYIRPHRHRPTVWETVMTLQGHIDALIFDDEGRLIRRLPLKPGGDGIIQNQGAVWHSFVFVEARSVAFEIKPGPYEAGLDKEFAPWSPHEDAPEATTYARWMETAEVGDRWDGRPD
ncbi:MAG TPA: WbuC family cupin fold metalloprotein [Stellaceae bacterium]|nr:WbuC family cupin fold metalloprotein [Stellaceae bacterium]